MQPVRSSSLLSGQDLQDGFVGGLASMANRKPKLRPWGLLHLLDMGGSFV